MCLKEIGSHAQSMITILDSNVNIIGGGLLTTIYVDEHDDVSFDDE